MKNSRSNRFFPLWALLALPSMALSASISVTNLSESKDYLALVLGFPKTWNVELFPKQSFVDSDDGVHFAAGVAHGEDLPGKSDCFLYTKRAGQGGRLVFLSKRTEDIWYCAGSPALTLRKYSKGRESILVVLSIFEYQAPSGDRFKFPFLLDSRNSSGFDVGSLNDCVDRDLRGVILQRLSQLDEPIEKCTGMRRDLPRRK